VRFFCFLRQSAAQITIGDYAKWRPIFDKHKPLRDRAGQNNVRAYRGADNPKELVIWSEVSDAAKAREALGSPEIKVRQNRQLVTPITIQAPDQSYVSIGDWVDYAENHNVGQKDHHGFGAACNRNDCRDDECFCQRTGWRLRAM
jgi:hypothetical protein